MFNFSKYQEISKKIQNLGKKTKIIAISKNHPMSLVEDAISRGVRMFGENKVQEAKLKFSELKDAYSDIQLHLTGPLQTNKVKDAIKLFDIFHTLDREKLAREFTKSGRLEGKQFFIQVNTGREKNKSGIHPELLSDFILYCKKDLSMNIVGLMCIPPINEEPKEHFSYLASEAKKNNLLQLSMGMSADYMKAIELNATYIRIGTELFGKREYEKQN